MNKRHQHAHKDTQVNGQTPSHVEVLNLKKEIRYDYNRLNRQEEELIVTK